MSRDRELGKYPALREAAAILFAAAASADGDAPPDVPAKAPRMAQDARNGVGLTHTKADPPQRAQAAILALAFREAGVHMPDDLADELAARLVAAIARAGWAIAPGAELGR